MSFGDRVVALLVILILLSGALFWRGHPVWAGVALVPVAVVVIGTIASVSDDPVTRRIRKARESVARLARIGLKPSPSADEATEAKILAELLCGELAHDLERATSKDLVAALKNRGPARSSVLRALSRMSDHLGTPEAIAAVRQNLEDFGPDDFVSLLRLHRYASQRDPSQRAVPLAVARRVVAETPPERRGEIFPSLLLIAPVEPEEAWIALLRPYASEFLSRSPLGPDEYAASSVDAWQARWREALARNA